MISGLTDELKCRAFSKFSKIMFQPQNIEIIAFDADDTLWHNESIFTLTQEKYKKLLAKYHAPEWIESRLYETETRNILHFGYGVKGFTLSMIETAIELSEGRITGNEIGEIIEFAKEMLKSPVELLEGVSETLHKLSAKYDLMIITKGDLLDQESKIARSGISELFSRIEIVREKDQEIYAKLFAKHKIAPDKLLMVGNSLKSDVLPIVQLGGNAIHIPYQTTWAREIVSAEDLENYKYTEMRAMTDLLDLL